MLHFGTGIDGLDFYPRKMKKFAGFRRTWIRRARPAPREYNV